MIVHNFIVRNLAWTSNGKKLISSSHLIRIFDTATWQEIATLEGHTQVVYAITLSFNERFLASASWDKTARLWNLDTNLPIGPPLQHRNDVSCAAISADGKLLVTGSENENAYTWDIHAILKEAGLEDLLQPLLDVAAQESLMNADATQAMDDELWPGFFDNVTNGVNRSRTYGHSSSSRRPHPLAASLGSAGAPFGRLSSLFRRFQHHTNEEIELPQRRAIFFRRRPRVVEVAAVKDRDVIFTAPPPPEKTQQQNQSHAQGSSTTQPTPGSSRAFSLLRISTTRQ
ncbi:WD40-repeat-containing domain protein [Suillus fuscotomentosus]|uniref:WD40-repeat-containing domain protein n=1 Tax=Suillus fuscotomentosus TaxID=1912939 RepID=A0AAD4E1Q9_9AGAM|nr:WD40-repeat-containing domain protein [Suillus fuscotomentosus]KAG1898133.1 WD40-repeat-containing domain protein [Suillus fuscotomentosus]